MFCPKCGTQNPDNGKFCRTCGTDLGNVSQVLSGGNLPQAPPQQFYIDRKGRFKSKDPDELWASGIKGLITGIGFLVVAVVLFETGVAGGHAWWWAMLFPAFGSLSSGISQMVRAKQLMKRNTREIPLGEQNQFQQNQFSKNFSGANLPPSQTDYAAPESRYKTGDLVPPSVVEATTRHLEMNSDGETMTLPKK